MYAFIIFSLKKSFKKSTWVFLILLMLVPISLMWFPVFPANSGGALVPGFFFWFPMIVGLLILPKQIIDFKTTSMIKRIGQTGLTKYQFFLSLFLIYFSIMIFVFGVNFLIFIGLSNTSFQKIIDFNLIVWPQFVYSYILACILFISTGFIIPILFRYSSLLTTAIMTFMIIFFLIMGNGIFIWEVFLSPFPPNNWGIPLEYVILPEWVANIQLAIPWISITKVFSNTVFEIPNNSNNVNGLNFLTTSMVCLATSIVLIAIPTITFKFEKIR